jgi:hypothetical protein
VLAFPAIRVETELAQRAVEVYDVNRLDFADAPRRAEFSRRRSN